ncbi:MAG: hypothetical protein J5699_06225 [Bacteroidales bacterium]|nr:hypothetical protein [Bacteroidales bacterium]
MKHLSIIVAAAFLTVLGAQNVYAQSYASIDGKSSVEYSNFRVAVQGGWGYRTAKVDPELTGTAAELVKGLKSGYVLGADAAWYFVKDIGLGATFHEMFAHHKVSNMTAETGITFAAPQVSTRYVFDRHSLLVNISLGYLSYRLYSYTGAEYRENGKTLGYGADLCYDYALTPGISIGVTFGALNGILRKLKVREGWNAYDVELDEGNYVSLDHISIMAGLRFTL